MTERSIKKQNHEPIATHEPRVLVVVTSFSCRTSHTHLELLHTELVIPFVSVHTV